MRLTTPPGCPPVARDGPSDSRARAALSDPANMEGMASHEEMRVLRRRWKANERARHPASARAAAPPGPTTDAGTLLLGSDSLIASARDRTMPRRRRIASRPPMTSISLPTPCASAATAAGFTTLRPRPGHLLSSPESEATEADLSSAEQKTVATCSYKTMVLLFPAPAIAKNARPISRHDRFHELYVHPATAPRSTCLAWGRERQQRRAARPRRRSTWSTSSMKSQGFFSALALGRRLLNLCAGPLVPGPEQAQPGSRGRTRTVVPVRPASFARDRKMVLPQRHSETLEARDLVKSRVNDATRRCDLSRPGT